MKRIISALTLPAASLLLAALATQSLAQFGPPRIPVTPESAQDVAPYDIEGYWVSLVTEDWRFRMVTPAAGDYPGIFLTEAGTALANSWDAAVDEAAGLECKAYGVGGIMRMPTRLKIDWDDDNILEIETDAGRQTRMIRFGAAQDGSGAGSLQGVSNGSLSLSNGGGYIEVDTAEMSAGYLRRNGVPYSEQSTLKEYFDVIVEDDGTEYLTVLSIIEDPVYLVGPYMTSTTFRREANGRKFDPEPCLAL